MHDRVDRPEYVATNGVLLSEKVTSPDSPLPALDLDRRGDPLTRRVVMPAPVLPVGSAEAETIALVIG